MQITITQNDDRVKVACSDADEKINYLDIVGVILSALEGATKTLLEDLEEDERSLLYDQLDSIFGSFLERLFPEIDPEEFTLIDAAIIKAEDEIINDAYKRGISLEDALQEYHDKAVKYIKQRRMN